MRLPLISSPRDRDDRTMVGRGQELSAEIDRQVKELVKKGRRLYRLDEQAFRRAQPDLILTQDLCHVCAVTPDQLTRAIQCLPHQVDVVTLGPTTIEGMILDIERIAEAVGQLSKGQALADSLRCRLDLVRERTATLTPHPRVLCLEWLAPLYVAGHWVPEMVELAGGSDVLGSKGVPSRETTWAEVEAAQPDIVLLMPCGYSIDRTIQELVRITQGQNEWRRLFDHRPRSYVVDSASYFSRSGPRLVDGVELLTTILHPGPDHPVDPAKAINLESAISAMDAAS